MTIDARVLVVEDCDATRRVMARIVTLAGFEVVEAGDGEAAIRLLRDEGGIDVVVSDVSMPRADGVELLHFVTTHDPEMPVILVTGIPTMELASRAIEDGVFHYLHKPFRPRDLERVVKRAVFVRHMAKLRSNTLSLPGPAGLHYYAPAILSARLDRALKRLWIAYQPIVNATDGSVYGYEALIRTDDPELNSPNEILQTAERLGRSLELSQSLRECSAAPLIDHEERGCLFLNILPSELLDYTLYHPGTELRKIAHRTVLEITERASIAGVKDIDDRVRRLRDLGFRIAIDDLGAGYAALTSFIMLEPEFVKIDITLVRGVDGDPVRQALIRSVTQICREIGIKAVAEGVETPEEWDCVVGLGCELIQGYLIGRPGRPFPSTSWPDPTTETEDEVS